MMNYYSLEEAARFLGTTPDELRKMADHNEIRAFRDRGNLRFRTQDIEERARQLGRGSDPDIQPGSALRPRPSDSPAPRKHEPEVFDFELDTDESEKVDLGSLAKPEGPSSKRSSRSGSKLGPPSPPPKTGSDSDVRLVPDGSDVDFKIASDSDVKMVKEPPPPPSSKKPLTQRKTGTHSDRRRDSGVRIVPLESDSDVKITPDQGDEGTVALGSSGPRSASDSDIRLTEPSSGRLGGSGKRPSKAEPPVTEEIDLDAELRQAGGSGRSRGRPPQPALPTSSPFELSDSDIEAARPGQSELSPDSSSDFDLTPASSRDRSPLELDAEDEEISLGELSAERGSGINLRDPADSGISLEEAGSGDAVEINLDSGRTPKPGKRGEELDSSGEFELSLDSDDAPGGKVASETDSSSEFELSLDADEGTTAQADSDSEFELSLDDSGGLAPLEGEEGAEEKDIFETDFEVPALDEESGSQAVALDEGDTDLESSDFDLAIGEDEIESEEESHSQVVAIGEEDEEVEAVTKPRRRRADDEEEEAEAEEEAVSPAVAAAPAPWGILPALALFPCVIVMFLVALMAFELVHSMWGYHQPNKVSGLIIRPMAETFSGETLPDSPKK